MLLLVAIAQEAGAVFVVAVLLGSRPPLTPDTGADTGTAAADDGAGR